MNTPTTILPQQFIILFDGVCNLCCRWVVFLLRYDKKEQFRFASLQSIQAHKLLNAVAGLPPENESIVYIKGNDSLTESSAVLEILTDLGGIWILFGLLKLIPLKMRDSGYRFIARKRYKWFGKRAVCMLPTAENQKRFLT